MSTPEWEHVRFRCPDFWAKVRVGAADECWPWLLRSNVHGYGRLTIGGRKFLAHRVAWMYDNRRGAPEGMMILHSCDNKPCCNPAHLRAGTRTANAQDRVERQPQSWLKTTGESHGRAVLTAALVRQMREERRAGRHITDIAAIHGLAEGTVRNAVNRKTWKHVA